jgi:hypothetical protein
MVATSSLLALTIPEWTDPPPNCWYTRVDTHNAPANAFNRPTVDGYCYLYQ